MTNYIPISPTAAFIHVKGLDILSALSSGANYGRVYYYDASKAYLGYASPSSMPTHFSTASYDDTVTVVNYQTLGDAIKNSVTIANVAYVRLGGIPTASDIIITVDEDIIAKDGSSEHEERITDLEERVTALEENTTVVPDYWQTAVDEAVNKVKALQDAGGNDVVNFAWFSDLHYGGGKDYTGRVGILCAAVMDACDIPLALMNGDTLTAGSLATEEAVLTNLEGAMTDILAPIGDKRLMLVRGNHDDVYGSYTSGGTTTYYVNKVAPEKIYNVLHRPQATDTRRVFSGDGTYFYLDNVPQKVRFVCLNSHFYEGEAVTNGTTKLMTTGFGAEQLDWLENAALAVDEGWGVVVAMHTPPISAYASQYTSEDYTRVRSIITTAADRMIAVFCGHMHRDIAYTDDLPCPIVVVTCAADSTYDSTEADRTAGTATETAIDIVSINRSTKTIHTTRLGVGSDREVSYTGGGAVGGSFPGLTASDIAPAIGTTFPPSQKPASDDINGSDIDVLSATADDIHAYIDEVVSGKNTVTKETLGKDASGKYDIARYIFANREYCAWQRENYPKMYGWKNDSTVMYTESVSPRVGDKAYSTPYVGADTTTETVTVPAQAAIVSGYRWSASGGSFKDSGATCSTVIIPTKNIPVPFTITLENATIHSSYNSVYGGNPTPTGSTQYGTASGNTVNVTTATDCIWLFLAQNGTGDTYESAKFIVNGNEVPFVLSTTTGYVNDVKQESTTTVETETSGTPITEVRVAAVTDSTTPNTIPSSRIIGGLEYVRSEADDVEPTVIYTDADDDRNGEATITQDGITYRRYPIGDLGANRTKLIPVFIYANEHGIVKDPANATNDYYETKMCGLVAARLVRDLCAGKQMNNPLYKFIRENCMLVVIPVANPWGYNHNLTDDMHYNGGDYGGYYNYNIVNINRNYDTPGWIVSKNGGGGHHGTYPGSENETQYIMNTMVESGAVVAMSLHGLGNAFGGTTYGHCAHQGQNPDGSHYDQSKMEKINALLRSNYGYEMVYYDSVSVNPPSEASINTPDIACKSPSYITYCDAYGGIVEFQPDDPSISGYKQEMKPKVIENAYAQTLNLIAMWLADYLGR